MLLLGGLAGCGAVAPAAPEARYAGALPDCGGPAASLSRRGDVFAFAPGDGSLVIRGRVQGDGGFAGALNTQPPGKPAFVLTVRGRLTEDAATLRFATPRCHADATLARVHPGVF